MIDAQTMARREAPRYGLLIRIGTVVPFRVATVVGWIETTDDDTLDPGQIYKGMGILTGLPAMRQLIGGTAERIEFRFSAASAIPQAWVDDPDSDINGADINVGIFFLSPDWSQMLRQPNGDPPVAWMWDGHVDVAAWNYDKGGESITLSCGSDFTDRGRAGLRYWTQSSHQSRHPGDNLCKLVVGYTQTRTLGWPR